MEPAQRRSDRDAILLVLVIAPCLLALMSSSWLGELFYGVFGAYVLIVTRTGAADDE